MRSPPTHRGEAVREKILAALPGTSNKVGKVLGLPRPTVQHHMDVLLSRGSPPPVGIIGTSPSPNGGRPVAVYGRMTGKPWVAPPRISVNTPHRSHWIGGYPPHYPPQEAAMPQC